MSISYRVKDFFLKTSARLNNVQYKPKPKLNPDTKTNTELKKIINHQKKIHQEETRQRNKKQEQKEELAEEIEQHLQKLKQNANRMLIRDNIDQKKYNALIKKINYLTEELKKQKKEL